MQVEDQKIVAYLSESEKVDIRRFCGYPVIGSCDTSQESWRFFQVEGALEWRLIHLSSEELRQVRLYLEQLDSMEKALAKTTETLDTMKAAVWTRNENEIQDRMILFLFWRKRLCAFLGVKGGLELHVGKEIIV